MAAPKPSGRSPAGVATTAPVPGSPGGAGESHDAVALSTVIQLLDAGIRVTLRRYSKSGGRPLDGKLFLPRNGSTLAFTPRRGPGATQVLPSSVREVDLDANPGTENTCRIMLKEGAPGSSFSFVCKDSADGLSSSEVTKYATFAIQERFNLVPAAFATSFDLLLQPLGLADKYCEAFVATGLEFESLGVVTREDLAEVVGITDRVDQINIFGQIERRFRGGSSSLNSLGDGHKDMLGPSIFSTHLDAGIRVVVKKCGPGQSGAPENGTLSLRDDSVVFTVEGARTTVMSTKMSSIGEISVEQEEGSNVCRVSLKEGESGTPFSFLCRDAAGDLPSSDFTKRIALKLQETLRLASMSEGHTNDTVHPKTPFAKLLEPLGLVNKYHEAFVKTGIRFENLGIVTREDLAEVVDITNRVDQINILWQIDRCFRSASPSHGSCGCSCRQGESGDSFLSALESGTSAAESVVGIVETLAGL